MLRSAALFLILTGGLLALAGLGLLVLEKMPHWGRLPGDIRIEGKSSVFYFPLTTCLLLSLLLTLLLNLLARLGRR